MSKDLTGWVYGQREDGTENRNGKGTIRSRRVSSSRQRKTAAISSPRRRTRTSSCGSNQATENANNGIGIRAPLQGDAAYTGIDIKVLDDSGSQYANYVPRITTAPLPDVSGQARTPEASGEWNAEEITVKGRKITVKLNEVVITKGTSTR